MNAWSHSRYRTHLSRRTADARIRTEPRVLPRRSRHGDRGEQGESAYLRGFGDYELRALKLTHRTQPGVAHAAFRLEPPRARTARPCARRERAGRGWIDGDLGHGPAYQFVDPDGHLLELFWESERYRPTARATPGPAQSATALHGPWIGVRRLDHLNFLGVDPGANREFLEATSASGSPRRSSLTTAHRPASG